MIITGNRNKFGGWARFQTDFGTGYYKKIISLTDAKGIAQKFKEENYGSTTQSYSYEL